MGWSDVIADRATRQGNIAGWKAAAESGDIDAQIKLAWEYVRGDVLAQDIPAATHWFENAAKSGNEEARVNQARFLCLRGVPKGIRELRDLAANNNWKAQFWLGRHFQSQTGRINQLRAVVWFERSFKNGNITANISKIAQLRKIASLPLKIALTFKSVFVIGITSLRAYDNIDLYEQLTYGREYARKLRKSD
jgi:TPR repeat protein